MGSEKTKRIGNLKKLLTVVTDELLGRSVSTSCVERLTLIFANYEKENDCAVLKIEAEFENDCNNKNITCKLAVHTDKGIGYQYFSLDKPVVAV